MNICMYVCMYVLYAHIRVCMHVCIYVIFKLGFERYRGGIVLVGRGNCPGGIVREGRCPGEGIVQGEMSGPPISSVVT